MIRKYIHYYIKSVYAVYYAYIDTIYYNLDFDDDGGHKKSCIVVVKS